MFNFWQLFMKSYVRKALLIGIIIAFLFKLISYYNYIIVARHRLKLLREKLYVKVSRLEQFTDWFVVLWLPTPPNHPFVGRDSLLLWCPLSYSSTCNIPWGIFIKLWAKHRVQIFPRSNTVLFWQMYYLRNIL